MIRSASELADELLTERRRTRYDARLWISGFLYNALVLDPIKRFSNRVENYLKYRPRYPREIIPLLQTECGLTSKDVVADLGSGTGLLTELFLQNGNRVFGIEPNADMRSAGEKVLAKYPDFVSIAGAAEATTLPNHSIDFIVSGQAFHWFDRERARPEFLRILKPHGWIVVMWNGYRTEKSQMMKAYQDLVIKYGTDYSEVRREVVGCDVESFYAPGVCRLARFEFQQMFDFEGLRGRLLSSSYAPEPGHPSYKPMLADLERVFDANSVQGKVAFDYETEIYYGQLQPA